MACSCPVEPVAFAVPTSLRKCAPETSAAATICPYCLAVGPADDGAADPDFARVSDGFPPGEAGVALALCLGLLASLATNREQIADALEAVERGGADPLLAIDRLLADPSIDPAIDLERRRHQLEQLFF